MKVLLFYGSKLEFIKHLPVGDIPTIVDLAVIEDEERQKLKLDIPRKEEEEEKEKEKEQQNRSFVSIVGYSNDFPALTESTIESFLSFIYRFRIENLYLQNPPDSIAKQIKEVSSISCETIRQEYSVLEIEKLKLIKENYSNEILGQENARQRIIGALYDVSKKRYKKPCVLLFYGSSGVGKTETAKYIADTIEEPLFRKQFSMLHSEEFTSYLFGGKHSQNSFARDLLERESNVILLDEFDKPNSVFYSAFYQLFDEGVFSDKNYTLKMDNAIIICTSNFISENQIRERLGDPIFSRFDAIIKFNDLSAESVRELINREYNKQFKLLDDDEKRLVEKASILDQLLSFDKILKNARQVRRIVREAISGILIKSL